MDDLFKPQCETLSRRTRRRLELQRAELRQHGKHPLLGRPHDPYAVNTIEVGTSPTAADTSRNPSPNLWGAFRDYESTPNRFMDDFICQGNATMTSAVAGSLGRWSVYGYAGSTVSDAGIEGGVLGLTSNDDQEGVCILSSTSSFRMVTTSTLTLNKKLAFEARVARSTIATTKGDMFVGLMAPTLASGLPAAAQPITTTDDTLMTAGDFFGFHNCSSTGTRGGMTEVAAAFELASGTVNYPTNLTTLMASSGNSVLAAQTGQTGFVKLGFLFDPNGPYRRITSATARQTAGQVKRALIRFFVNGLETPAFLTADDVQNATSAQAFPTAFMAPCFAMMNTASAGMIGYIDWIQVAQSATA